MTTKADADVIRELEAMAANREAGFWSQVLAVSAIRMITQRDAEIARLQAQVDVLAGALKPFSAVLLPFHDDQPDSRVVYSTVDGAKKFPEGKLCITLGDLRRARSAS